MLKVFPNTHFGGIDAKPRSAMGRLSSARSSPGSVVWPVRKLTPTHIEAFEAQLQQDGHVKGRKASQGLTAQTVLHVHRTLSQALAHAVNAGVLFKNPAEQVKPPRPLRKEIAILSKPEIATLLRASEGTPLYLPVLITVTTGVRRGELLALRWSDIDLKAARLTVISRWNALLARQL